MCRSKEGFGFKSWCFYAGAFINLFKTIVMKIEAEYIGKDKEGGYNKKCQYDLEINQNIFDTSIRVKPIGDLKGGAIIIYPTLKTFLENWSNIKLS